MIRLGEAKKVYKYKIVKHRYYEVHLLINVKMNLMLKKEMKFIIML